jgi:hypothetical protein
VIDRYEDQDGEHLPSAKSAVALAYYGIVGTIES